MKKAAPFMVFISGLVAVPTLFISSFEKNIPPFSFWSLLALWSIAGIVGFVIISNALKIDQGITVKFNLVKVVYLPLLVLSFLIYAIFNYVPPLLFSVSTGSFGLLFGGLLLILRSMRQQAN